MMSSKANDLKDQGNKQYADGHYREAEYSYTLAIQSDPRNPKLFTNRAMARLKFDAWDPCIDDCLKSIELGSSNMKGFYYLAQAQLALKHPNEAHASALTAYEKCIETFDRSTSAVSALVLRAKKEKWESKERERLRKKNEMLRELEDALLLNKATELRDLQRRQLSATTEAEERVDIEVTSEKKINELRNIFALTDPQNLQRREVPDYMIDSISFSIMHDPVVTKTGNSYDRSTVIEHLKRSATDPLTREPLTMADLRPNLALKQACEDFLSENGWAVDW